MLLGMLIRIFCEENKQEDLTNLGIGLGMYDAYENCFTKCICPNHIIPKLKKKYKFCLEDTTNDACWYS